MNSADATAVVESVGEDRPREFVVCSATRNLEVSSSLTPMELEELRLLRQLAAVYRRDAA